MIRILALLTMALAAWPLSAAVREPKVVLIVIDGVRALELAGAAKDDDGKAVRASDLFPNLFALKKKGVFLPEMQISNPAGVSLPAYSDIFAGRRQERIVDNHPEKADFHSHYPTIFQAVKEGLRLGPDGVALLASWDPLCAVAVTPDGGGKNDFFRSCGWSDGFSKGHYFKPELYEGSRTDADTFIELLREVPKRHPRFLFVHLVDADEEAHFHEDVMEKAGVAYGIYNYHKALREDDYYVGRIWSMLQSDPFYKDSTTLIVTTDHGRDNYPDPKQWSNHGACVKKGAKELCSGCRHVFGAAVGPGLKATVSKKAYTHADLAPTVAKILGVPMPSATGTPIPEIAR